MIASRYALLLIALGALLLVSCVVSLGFGPARVPVDVVWQILLNKLFGIGDKNWSAGQEHIVWLIRVPRMLLGALVGAGLALIGAKDLRHAPRPAHPLADMARQTFGGQPCCLRDRQIRRVVACAVEF